MTCFKVIYICTFNMGFRTCTSLGLQLPDYIYWAHIPIFILYLITAKFTCTCNMDRAANLFARSDNVVVIDREAECVSLTVCVHVDYSTVPFNTQINTLIRVKRLSLQL